MEKIYQKILEKLITFSNSYTLSVTYTDVTAAATRKGIVCDDIPPFLRYLPENGCKVDAPENPEEEQLLRLAKLSRYDEALEKILIHLFSGLKPSDESCVGTMESITEHLARLHDKMKAGVDMDVLWMKTKNFSAEKIARTLEKPIEEIYCTEKRIHDAIWKTHPRHYARRKRIRDFYVMGIYDEILEEAQVSANGDQPVLTYEQVRSAAELKCISEESLQNLVDYLVRHDCIVLSSDGELRMIPQESQFRCFKTEEHRLRYYSAYGKWIIRTIIVNKWYETDAEDEKDLLHKERFMKHLKRDDLLTIVYSMRNQGLGTRQMGQELGKDPEEIVAAEERIWNLYKASFPVMCKV